NSEPFSVKEEKRKWKSELATKLTEAGNLVYTPNFPNPINASYNDWKIFFEAWIECIEIKGELTLIGHSLGGNFLLKYFSENSNFSHSIKNIHLVAACISAGDFTTPENYDTLRSLGSKVHIWNAEDDTVVPFVTAKQLQKELPEAQTHFFGSEKGYGHFSPLAVFPEFEDVILQK
ncbi:alpha/beta hydrolase, partial [Candidatus Gracilibacteria bacterium]|nr:alpha/beta hydrolase [Candidatus Gracilibacteria bacterium]